MNQKNTATKVTSTATPGPHDPVTGEMRDLPPGFSGVDLPAPSGYVAPAPDPTTDECLSFGDVIEKPGGDHSDGGFFPWDTGNMLVGKIISGTIPLEIQSAYGTPGKVDQTQSVYKVRGTARVLTAEGPSDRPGIFSVGVLTRNKQGLQFFAEHPDRVLVLTVLPQDRPKPGREGKPARAPARNFSIREGTVVKPGERRPS